ncbi:branched-chain amino acid ABC transporter permease [Marinibaculum pumilum]|uniref:Branched-chain amino acid ABC transporter permease n=1 Tax=Marinibaculum pumilum TaxID=1766165 RepID=A0ABV7L7Q2_9PROT
MTILLQHVIDAVSVGGLFAMMALGIGLIFGIMRLINFAHGELVMIGGYAMWLVVAIPGPLVVLFSIAVVVALALGMERIAFRPLRQASPATLLISSFAVSYFLQNLVVMIIGSRPKPFTFAEGLTQNLQVGELRLPLLQLVTIALTIAVLAGITLFLKRTPMGVLMRAASQDFRMARLCGVRANMVIAAAFVMSALLAWAVSLVYAVQTGQLSPAMGLRPALIGFVATVIGGLGSLPGAAVGGFLVGVLTVLLQILLPPELRDFRDAFLFALVLVVLLFRPRGLLAVRAEMERV